jgi:hypothetical protein
MFDKLRERLRTRQAYVTAPVTYEVLGIQGDERDVKWFTRHFGHRTLTAMFTLYFAYGIIVGSVAGIIASGGVVGDAAIIGFTLGIIFLVSLLIEKHESKKVT